MKRDAGKVEITVPSIIMAIGSVARSGAGLNCCPTTPLRVITVIAATINMT
jgi:hypothetical protein